MTERLLNNTDAKRKGISMKRLMALGLCLVFLVVGGIVLVKWFEKNQVLKFVGAQRADLRTLRSSLEAYRVDTGVWPDKLERLTTPVAYRSQLVRDLFNTDGDARYYLHPSENASEARWVIWSVGPDGLTDLDEHLLEQRLSTTELSSTEELEIFRYDVTNGTLSEGDVFNTDSDWDWD